MLEIVLLCEAPAIEELTTTILHFWFLYTYTHVHTRVPPLSLDFL